MPEKKKKKRVGSIIFRIILIIIAGLTVGIGVFTWNASGILGNKLPMPLGFGVSVIMSPSMEPELHTNDLAFVVEQDSYELDDIVVFQEGNMLVIHRIIDIDGDKVITKGDANSIADDPIKMEDIKAKLTFHIPFIGLIFKYIKTVPGTLLILALALFLLYRSRQKERDKDREELEDIVEEIKRLRSQQSEKAKSEGSDASDGSSEQAKEEITESSEPAEEAEPAEEEPSEPAQEAEPEEEESSEPVEEAEPEEEEPSEPAEEAESEEEEPSTESEEENNMADSAEEANTAEEASCETADADIAADSNDHTASVKTAEPSSKTPESAVCKEDSDINQVKSILEELSE